MTAIARAGHGHSDDRIHPSRGSGAEEFFRPICRYRSRRVRSPEPPRTLGRRCSPPQVLDPINISKVASQGPALLVRHPFRSLLNPRARRGSLPYRRGRTKASSRMTRHCSPMGSTSETAEVLSAHLEAFMSVPFQYTWRCRRLRRSAKPAIMLALVFGLTGIYVNLPPLSPQGNNPEEFNRWKSVRCGNPVLPEPDGHCTCDSCSKKFKAADAKDYP